tara:strand:+ start:224 stop:385 length:162 start_codon:yes stop_codon:yes gene_type:complete
VQLERLVLELRVKEMMEQTILITQLRMEDLAVVELVELVMQHAVMLENLEELD